MPVRANRQPAVATYVRMPGEADYRAFALAVLSVAGGQIAEVTTLRAGVFAVFGLADRRRSDEF